MDEYGDEYWIRLVLHKLKATMMSGRLKIEDGVRYVYEWDNKKSKSYNLKRIKFEDRALLYLLQIGVFEGEHIANEYRSQQLKRLRDEGVGVWSDWKKVDHAYREYAWEVEVYGIHVTKFNDELEKFGLKDAGATLVEVGKPLPLSPTEATIGAFTAHDDGTVRYDGKLIGSLKPQERKLVHRLILAQGTYITRNQIKDSLWDVDDENNFAAKATTTEPMITKRIGSTVSDINKLLYSRGNKQHIKNGGGTSYAFIP